MKLEWSDEIYYVTGGKHKYSKHEGVYVIAERLTGKKKARYVGQGKIAERMKAHESDNEQNTRLKTLMKNRDNVLVYYAEVPHQTERENAERSLFDYFGGTEKLFNEIVPAGEITTINPPKFLQDISFD